MRLFIKSFWYLAGKIYALILNAQPNIRLGKNIRFRKLPSIYVHRKARLIIGNNVMLNSENSRYHINMHSPCKLLLDKPGGVIKIGDNSRIHGTCIHAYESITVGRNCLIAANTQIIDGNAHELSFPDVENRINTFSEARPVVIEDHVWIGANVIILPGVTVGRGSVIAAGSVVNKSIPPMTIAGGNPAKVIKNMSVANENKAQTV